MKINKLEPVYLKGFNDGAKHGEKMALEKFHRFITEKMGSIEEIDGIGEKTAWKIHKHLLDAMLEENERG